jgi:hypothetical protein
MRRVLTVVAVASAAAFGSWFSRDDGARAADVARASTVAVRIGDRVRVLDAPIACRVVRMSQLGGRAVVDCRRAGPLAGTYGTLLTAHEALLVRFQSKHAARRMVVATHGGDVRRCEAGS